mmetsp:Transcript_7257/g.12234  ORF Transcript_7257/g.12234 Transcript_7257/m.12234 type:complete len:217 (+) Transcript_7257:133-783(+)|eukprot:CAMPEP_0206163768 /NCGR_PEP_ID=MMETSP1474-20131121/11614_1 /ASSEMBLY_ACC=CAM_ASM_001110 /TAXON_ID=97495 /ORGANISM="Imantonia sp., Strain RCC918" /LENGTH=216 /DNA_ID=CAMNT_0053566339 /DNA_START=112 /DNA_END=762 /DNA_ORIENTATION=-
MSRSERGRLAHHARRAEEVVADDGLASELGLRPVIVVFEVVAVRVRGELHPARVGHAVAVLLDALLRIPRLPGVLHLVGRRPVGYLLAQVEEVLGPVRPPPLLALRHQGRHLRALLVRHLLQLPLGEPVGKLHLRADALAPLLGLDVERELIPSAGVGRVEAFLALVGRLRLQVHGAVDVLLATVEPLVLTLEQRVVRPRAANALLRKVCCKLLPP